MPKPSHPGKDLVAGGFSGICTILVGFPFDTVKTLLQSQPKYKGFFDCFIQTVRNEGFLALYKGMAIPLLGTTPMFAACFAGFGVGKRLQGEGNKTLHIIEIFNAGMLAGCFTTLIMAPSQRIKCLLQIQTHHKSKYQGPIDCARKLYFEGGIRNLYKGTIATLARDIPGNGIYFSVLEIMKQFLQSDGEPLPPFKVMLSGGVAGVTMWLAIIPIDTIKTRIQIAPMGAFNRISDAFKDLTQKQGQKIFPNF